MKKKVLITGGADFIGSHLADELLRHGYVVRALDNLSPQVHGEQDRRPKYLDREVELIQGDVSDLAVVERALAGIDVVYHFLLSDAWRDPSESPRPVPGPYTRKIPRL
jgi:dTDP-L-rhamnose 4-epimerase